MSKTVKWILAGVGVVAALAVFWYLAGPLFYDRTVDEAFPVTLPSLEEAAAMPADELEATLVEALDAAEGMSEDEMAAVADQVQELAAVMPDKETADAMPEGEPIAVLSGQFVDIDRAHRGSGDATIYELPDGSRVLRFDNFEVTNGPDLHVLLATGAGPTGRDDLGDTVDLGPLKGNVGSQNYEIPADVDLSDIQSIVIYCVPFHVVFSTATLSG